MRDYTGIIYTGWGNNTIQKKEKKGWGNNLAY